MTSRIGIHRTIRVMLACGALVVAPALAVAGEADVVAASVTKSGEGQYRFNVTVAHDDTDWDHYANVWEVIGPDGTVLGTRVLAHPHVNEQPFTRSLSGVAIPEDVISVTIRAGDLVHGFGGAELELALPTETGESHSVSK
jgi:hypothetical protein